jgi:hypothetical protein
MEAPRAAYAKWIRLGTVTAVGLAVSVALGRGAYAKTARARECATLSSRINPVVDEIRGLTRGKHDGPTYKTAAARYAELASSLKKVAQGELAAEAEEYTEMLAATARTLAAGAAAVEAGSASGIGEARRELERLVRKERVVVAKIEAYCRAR